jgi:urea transport system ATP-binding protein
MSTPSHTSTDQSLNILDLDIYYGQSRILRQIKLNVKPGRIVALMGRNGVGKTTLLKAITGLLPAKAGEINFLGKNINALSTDKRAKLGIGYVPQGREIFPKMTIEENLQLGLEARADGNKKLPKDEMYALFPFLAKMEKRLGGNLSGGQQQQLAIARALVGGPKVLLLDEPTEGIQPSIIDEIENVLTMLKQRGDMSIILVEQYFEFAKRLADDVAVMDRGTVILSGEMNSIPEEEIRSYIAF